MRSVRDAVAKGKHVPFSSCMSLPGGRTLVCRIEEAFCARRNPKMCVVLGELFVYGLHCFVKVSVSASE
jgi:hypothetical protein